MGSLKKMKSQVLARKQNGGAAILKSTCTNINIRKNSAQRRNLPAKTYEQQTTKHQIVKVLETNIFGYIFE